MIGGRVRLLASLWLSAALGAAPVTAWAREGAAASQLSLVERELNGLDQRLGALRADVSGGTLSRSERVISERYNEARYAFLVGDHERCSLLLWSLVENDDLRGDARLPETEWLLGACLAKSDYLGLAQARFQRIVDAGPTHPFYAESLLQLIELFGRSGNTAKFEDYYQRFLSSSVDDSATARRIRYELGKSFYRQGRLGEAQAVFAAFPTGSAYSPQAAYFSGVVQVEEGRRAAERGEPEVARQRYEEGISAFRRSLSLPASTPEHAEVRDLSHLAIARLLYETGRITEALDEYRRVAPTGGHYNDALYELIWAYIELATQTPVQTGPEQKNQRARFTDALRSVEIFQLAYPNDPREPTVRLVAGHIRVRMAEYNKAIDRYRDAAQHFRSLRDELEAIVTASGDPMQYFDQLVDPSFVAAADFAVPKEAVAKARSNPVVDAAVDVAGELYGGQRDLEDADELLDQLEAATVNDDGVDLIQTYRLHRQQLATAESAVFAQRQRLVDLEVAWFDEQGLTGAAAIRTEVGRDESPTERLTRLRAEVDAKRHAFELQADAVGTRIFDLENEIREQLETLRGAEEYLVRARREGRRTREDELALRKEIEQERAALEAGLAELDGYRRRLRPSVLTAALRLPADVDEANRSSASTALRDVERRLRGVRGGASNEFFVRLDAARGRLDALEARAVETRDLLQRAESKDIQDIVREVAFQRREVDGLVAQAEGIEQQNDALAAHLGRQAFVDVAAFYEDMLARAEMGVIDVFWYRKEAASARKKELSREKNRRQAVLQDVFEDVLEERR